MLFRHGSIPDDAGALMFVDACHCAGCQRKTGLAFAMIEAEFGEVLAGKAEEVLTPSN